MLRARSSGLSTDCVSATREAREVAEIVSMHGRPLPEYLGRSCELQTPQRELRTGRGSAPSPVVRSTVLPLDVRRALGPLLTLTDDPQLRDVLVQVRHGVGELWLDRGGQAEYVEGWRADPEAVRRFAVGLIAAGGRRLDELHPCADVHLGAGIRAHAVLAPIVAEGAAVSIRLPRSVPLTFSELVSGGLCDARTAHQLRHAVLARQSLLISGGTGTGKTTLLAALLALVPETERIITIEDVSELMLEHPHHIALEARQANAEGAGELSVERLLRESLRMRPDRIVLGECRGAEVGTLLAALNTGHEGGAGTLHANSLGDVGTRLETLGMLAGFAPPVLARQAVAAFDLVVHLERSPARGHRIAALGRLELLGDQLAVGPA